MAKALKHKFEYFLTVSFAWLLRSLPAAVSVAFGMGLGWIGYRLLGIRKKVMLQNLRLAFPEKTDVERDKIALKAYCHWGGMAAEYARLPKMNDKYFDKYVEIEGEDVLFRAEEKGKGGLVISGHLGNWEIMGAVSANRGHGVTYIVASQTNKLVDKIMDDFRRSRGIEIWKTRQAPRGVFKSLKKNHFIALMIDQDAGKDCVFVDFFGNEASTHRGPAVFHLKTGSPLIMSSCIRLRGPYYRVRFEEVDIDIPEGTTEEKSTYVMAHLTKLLENQVRRNPEQYFWMHKRWKTRRP